MADTRVAPLPRYGWLDRSEVYHEIIRQSGVDRETYPYLSTCGIPFAKSETGNEPPTGRCLCKWCEEIRKESDD